MPEMKPAPPRSHRQRRRDLWPPAATSRHRPANRPLSSHTGTSPLIDSERQPALRLAMHPMPQLGSRQPPWPAYAAAEMDYDVVVEQEFDALYAQPAGLPPTATGG